MNYFIKTKKKLPALVVDEGYGQSGQVCVSQDFFGKDSAAE